MLTMETKGIEPSFPRCDRGVLPLHHVPESTFRFSYKIAIAANSNCKVFSTPLTDNFRTAIYHSRRFFPSAHDLVFSAHQRDSRLSSAQRYLYRLECRVFALTFSVSNDPIQHVPNPNVVACRAICSSAMATSIGATACPQRITSSLTLHAAIIAPALLKTSGRFVQAAIFRLISFFVTATNRQSCRFFADGASRAASKILSSFSCSMGLS